MTVHSQPERLRGDLDAALIPSDLCVTSERTPGVEPVRLLPHGSAAERVIAPREPVAQLRLWLATAGYVELSAKRSAPAAFATVQHFLFCWPRIRRAWIVAPNADLGCGERWIGIGY